MAPLILLALAAAGGYALIKSQGSKAPAAGGGGVGMGGSFSYDANLPPEAARAVDIALGRAVDAQGRPLPGETDVSRLRQFAATLSQYPIAQGAITTYANALSTGMGGGAPYVPGYTPGTPATPNTGYGGAAPPGNTGWTVEMTLPPRLGGGGGTQGPGSPPPADGSLGALLGTIGLAMPGAPATPTPAPAGGTLGQQVGTALGGIGAGLGAFLGGGGGGGGGYPGMLPIPAAGRVSTITHVNGQKDLRRFFALNPTLIDPGTGAPFRSIGLLTNGVIDTATQHGTWIFQDWWNRNRGGRLTTDGLFGPDTYAALKRI